MDAVAKALVEPNRREILRLVRDEERTASDIATHFEISRPAISQHLRVLEEADLVTVRPEGTRRWYRARPEGLGELRSWIDEFWSAQLVDLKREVEQEMWRRRRTPDTDTTTGTTTGTATGTATGTTTGTTTDNRENDS